MTNMQLQKTLTRMKEQINDAIQRLDRFSGNNHKENADQIADLQELVVDEAYTETLNDLGL